MGARVRSAVVGGLVLAGLGVVAPLGVPVSPAAAEATVCRPGDGPITGLVTTEKVVTFTFDDGPSSVHTRAVMDVFEARGLRATFFVLGNSVRANPTLAAEIVARGHEIGNHSKSHTYGAATNVKEMPKAQTMIEAATGVRPVFYRMPGLSWRRSVVKATAVNGLCGIDTNMTLGDWKLPRARASVLCTRFKKALRPGKLVVMHDGGRSHTQTVLALPCMLDYALAQGYQVLGLRDFLALATDGRATLSHKRVR